MTGDERAPADEAGAHAEALGKDSDSNGTREHAERRQWQPEIDSHAVDVTTLAQCSPRQYIIEGAWPEHSFFAIAAEEGDGKTLMADQIARELVRGKRGLGFFDPGEAVPRRILFVDTEMEEDDAKERNAEMELRGLGVPVGRIPWWSTGGVALDTDLGIMKLKDEVQRVRPDLVWIDSGINAVSNAQEEVPVKTFFNNLSRLMRSEGLLGIGLSLHTCKRAQGQTDRNFDDLFGSREWKGRLGTLLYMEGSRITSWKNRGGRLAKLFAHDPGRRPFAKLDRPGLVDPTVAPFVIVLPDKGDDKGEREEVERRIREVLELQPDTHTKTALAEKMTKRKKVALELIGELQRQGVVVPDGRGAKLHLAEVPDPSTDPTLDDSSQKGSL